VREIAEVPDSAAPFDDAFDATMAVFEMMKELPGKLLGVSRPGGDEAALSLPEWFPGSLGREEKEEEVRFRDFEDDFEDD
jgi:hypothetical protein